ncbi:hypothetical protein P3T20_004075 [Paraburkholderia sp. GAS206C]|uniref:hypothetical protein n=1 Tax=unclassified Paraburkholderia TaxID=2615204 RepID=UPI003D234EDB
MNDFDESAEEWEFFVNLDQRVNSRKTNVAGSIVTDANHASFVYRHLHEIERFVEAIQKTWAAGFVKEITRYARHIKVRKLRLGHEYYRSLNNWIRQYRDIHRYSARAEVFYDVCKELGLMGQAPFRFGKPDDIAGADGVQHMDKFNTLIDRIRERCQSREFKESGRLRRKRAERNGRNVLAMEKAMFSETGKSRWLLLSLTLRYKPEVCGSIKIKDVQRHRDRFFGARRYNALISGIKNYVWKIEQGEDTGLHLHVILFYSGDHSHDQFIARQICEYWDKEVTQGRGAAWSSNEAWLKRRYQTYGHGVGVGQINWNDAEKRRALRKNLLYLAKAGQYLMIRGAERVRTFDMGHLPTKVKSGRPRGDAGPGKPA